MISVIHRWQIVVVVLDGWMNRQQRQVSEYSMMVVASAGQGDRL